MSEARLRLGRVGVDMSEGSGIEWTDSTWNPVTGCTKISTGCQHCYAERMARRLQAMGQPNYALGFIPAVHEDALDLPLRWNKPQTIFVNSMSDLFHEAVPLEFVMRVFRVMHQAYWHRFQILTKRSARLLDVNPYIQWPANVWMGVSVESRRYLDRIRHLGAVGAHTKFLSLEPLLGPLPGLDLRGMDWVIVGGESGPGARPMMEEWVVDIRNQCVAADVPFFFKQWGGVNRKHAGRILQGRTWDQLPASAPAMAVAPA